MDLILKVIMLIPPEKYDQDRVLETVEENMVIKILPKEMNNLKKIWLMIGNPIFSLKTHLYRFKDGQKMSAMRKDSIILVHSDKLDRSL